MLQPVIVFVLFCFASLFSLYFGINLAEAFGRKQYRAVNVCVCVRLYIYIISKKQEKKWLYFLRKLGYFTEKHRKLSWKYKWLYAETGIHIRDCGMLYTNVQYNRKNIISSPN